MLQGKDHSWCLLVATSHESECGHANLRHKTCRPVTDQGGTAGDAAKSKTWNPARWWLQATRLALVPKFRRKKFQTTGNFWRSSFCRDERFPERKTPRRAGA